MKYREILEQLVNEINMSPSSLRKLSAGIDARAGMEFEMIIPGAAEADDDWEQEPDFDQDEPIRRLRDIREFFYDSDYNSSRDVDRLVDEIMENYMDSDWLSERKREEWESVQEEHIRDLVTRDYESDFEEQARQDTQDKVGDWGTNDEEFRAAYNERLEELINEKVNEILADFGSEYDEAYDEWENDQWQEIWNDDDMITEWLESEGIRNMSDIVSVYDITWPHYMSSSTGGDVSIEEVAEDFKQAIGRPVNWSHNYHGGRRAENTYVVEPDGSLEADDERDGGLEFVSPPLPLSELLSDLRTVKAWADGRGAYTNDSTGLHINVSVPGWTGDLNKLDYVKLALLLGDEYVLANFGRTGNTYAKSAFEIVKSNIRQRPDAVTSLLSTMKQHLNTAAAKIIHTGSTTKYTSINTKDGYIEFRSPGGDWLNENFDKIENTLLRFVVAMDAAVDETKYKEEYAKKLYKLLSSTQENSDILEMFAQFSAGLLPQSALKSFVRQAQLQRTVKKGPTGVKYWWSVGRPGYFASIEVVAASKEEAIAKAVEPGNYPDWAGARDITAKPIRPYDNSPVRATAGTARPAGGNLSQTDLENRLGWGSQSADANYEIVYRASNPPQRRFVFIANTPQEAQRKYNDWLAAQGLPPETEDYGFREIR